MKIIEDVRLVEFARKPKSKKKRILKKWKKRPENYIPAVFGYLRDKDTILCHPSVAKTMRDLGTTGDECYVKGIDDMVILSNNCLGKL